MDYRNLTLLDEIHEIIEKQRAILIYFSAPHCNVCKVLKPKVAELIREKYPEIELFYVNIEDAPIVSGQFRIFSIPTILIYFEGKEYLRKSRNVGIQELENDLKKPYSILFEN